MRFVIFRAQSLNRTRHPVVCVCVYTGFDLCEVGQEEVVLKTGKLANRRTLHFALQSLLALFGKHGSCF